MNKKKILIIDDEADFRVLLSASLREEGYEVFQAQNGLVAYLHVFKIKPDLIITDVLMPKMNGSEFIKRLRGTDFGKDVPLIVLTARHLMKDYFEDMKIDAFIDKPFKTNDMLKIVKKLLIQGEKKKELEKNLEDSQKIMLNDETQVTEDQYKVCEKCLSEMPLTDLRCPHCGNICISKTIEKKNKRIRRRQNFPDKNK